MNEPRNRSRQTLALLILVRYLGTASLFALVFVAAPHAWMSRIHEWVGLGTMPDTPVVWYLARSTSAFYALVGGLFWVISFDLPRYRPLLLYLGGAIAALGVILLLVDWLEGMPPLWAAWEGPVLVIFGAVMNRLARALPRGAGTGTDS